MRKRTPSKNPKQPQSIYPHQTTSGTTLEQLVQDPKDAEAYAALMRQLPIYTEQDDPEVAAAFKELDEFLEVMESPDEEEK